MNDRDVHGIRVAVRAASGLGRLRPRYDEDAGILAMESDVARPWPYGLNVGGSMVIDLDHSFVVANVDLHIPKRLWIPERELPWPTDPREGEIVAAAAAVSQKEFHALEVVVRCNEVRSAVRIELGAAPVRAAIRLSKDCCALIGDGLLVGFCARGF